MFVDGATGRTLTIAEIDRTSKATMSASADSRTWFSMTGLN
jgi:hypothetical protein